MSTQTSVTFKPLGNRIVVEPIDTEEQMSAGGIYIPDTAKEKPQEGKIVAIGPGRLSDEGKRIPVEVAVGPEAHRHHVLDFAAAPDLARFLFAFAQDTVVVSRDLPFFGGMIGRLPGRDVNLIVGGSHFDAEIGDGQDIMAPLPGPFVAGRGARTR